MARSKEEESKKFITSGGYNRNNSSHLALTKEDEPLCVMDEEITERPDRIIIIHTDRKYMCNKCHKIFYSTLTDSEKKLFWGALNEVP